MASELSYTLALFDPTQAERITGLTRTTQRDWRREGHLPSFQGMARYNLFDLAELWVLAACAKAGIKPTGAKIFSRSASIHLAWWVLHHREAFTGDHLMAPKSKYSNALDWGRQARWLADHIMYGNDDPISSSSFYVIWPDGEALPSAGDLDDEIFSRSRSPNKIGAVTVLPLESAANSIVNAAGEAFVEVIFASPERNFR